jgi:hypothetical protein
MLNPLALANTLAIVDLVLHPLFHAWVAIHPSSYEYLMHVFVAGLQVNVDPSFDLAFPHLVVGTFLEAGAFWILGYLGASLYNKLSK